VEFRGNRFYSLGAGFSYPAADVPLRISVVGNTFAKVNTGLAFGHAPPADRSRIEVKNNLFVDVPKLASLDRVNGQPADQKADWVWYEDNLGKGKETSIPAEPRYFRKTFTLDAVPSQATLDIGCANSFKVWVNGEFAGESQPPFFTKRVYAFDVARLLKPGLNVIAVEGSNARDALGPNFAVAAGLVAQLTDGAGKTILTTDGTWRASKANPAGWQQPNFDSQEGWTAAKVWPNPFPGNAPWALAVWDSVVQKQLAGDRQPVRVMAAGNYRDYFSHEGYPLLDSQRGIVQKVLPMDPGNDAQFLRYPRNHPLMTAGPDRTPVGVPQGD
jgi:hypothetical protein